MLKNHNRFNFNFLKALFEWRLDIEQLSLVKSGGIDSDPFKFGAKEAGYGANTKPSFRSRSV